MTTPTPMTKHQRHERRRSSVSAMNQHRLRIIALPAAGHVAIRPIERAPSPIRTTSDDLDLATWEDAEWR